MLMLMEMIAWLIRTVSGLMMYSDGMVVMMIAKSMWLLAHKCQPTPQYPLQALPLLLSQLT